MAPRLPSKYEFALLGYSWLAGAMLGPILTLILYIPLGALGFLLPPPLAGALALAASSMKFFVTGFFFVWLAEAPWLGGGIWSWLITMLAWWIDMRVQGAAPGFFPRATLAAILPGLLPLGVALLGAWVARRESWRPGLQHVRARLLGSLLLP